MRQFLPANSEDAGSLSFDLKPTLADDAWAVLLTRVGICAPVADAQRNQSDCSQNNERAPSDDVVDRHQRRMRAG